MHDTGKENANITASIKILLTSDLTEDQKKWIEAINQCNENLKNRLDRFYLDNKQN